MEWKGTEQHSTEQNNPSCTAFILAIYTFTIMVDFEMAEIVNKLGRVK